VSKLITRFIVKMCNDKKVSTNVDQCHVYKDYSDRQEKTITSFSPQTVSGSNRRLNIKHSLYLHARAVNLSIKLVFGRV